MHFKNGRREGVGVGGGISKTEKARGRSRERRKGERERGKKKNKTTGNKGMTSSNIPCYIRAEWKDGKSNLVGSKQNLVKNVLKCQIKLETLCSEWGALIGQEHFWCSAHPSRPPCDTEISTSWGWESGGIMNTGHEDYEWESDTLSNRWLSKRQLEHTHISDRPENTSFCNFSFFKAHLVLLI